MKKQKNGRLSKKQWLGKRLSNNGVEYESYIERLAQDFAAVMYGEYSKSQQKKLEELYNKPFTDCKKYKKGKFRGTSNPQITITRMKKYQIEENNGERVRLDLKWVDVCEYELKLTDSTIIENDPFADEILHVKIVKTDDKGYYFVTYFEGDSYLSGWLDKVD